MALLKVLNQMFIFFSVHSLYLFQNQNIRVWQADQDLYEYLTSLETGCEALTAVEGVIQPTGRTLGSQHGSEQGVILKTQLVEHRTRKINGFWSVIIIILYW